MSDVDRYTELLKKQRGLDVEDVQLVEFFPNPSTRDYLRGYITRYFAYQRNLDKFTEIDKESYNDLRQKNSISDLTIDVFSIN